MMASRWSRSVFIRVHPWLVLVYLTASFLGFTAKVNAQGALPPLPDTTGWGVHVLAVARDAQGTIWVGTYGRGIFRLPLGSTTWQFTHHDSTRSGSISWDFVHALAFGSRGEVWYGTVGNGWGLSTDGGNTWRNWTYKELGPEWQYVAPSGIVIRGDTTVIGTADGLQVTTDNGNKWTALVDAVGPPARGPADTAIPVLPSEYVRRVAAGTRGWTVATLRGNLRLTRTPAGWQGQPIAAAAFAPANALLIGRQLIKGTPCGLKPSADTLPCLRQQTADRDRTYLRPGRVLDRTTAPYERPAIPPTACIEPPIRPPARTARRERV